MSADRQNCDRFENNKTAEHLVVAVRNDYKNKNYYEGRDKVWV